LVLGQGAKLQKKSVIRIVHRQKKVGDSVIRVVVEAGGGGKTAQSRPRLLLLTGKANNN
jgi:hypothetical protein